MTSQQTKFTIQTLEGKTFQVSIPVIDAEKVFLKNTTPYHYYGLDYLKHAICSSTGIDSVSQQLICEEELTISTPLLPLADTVITLIVKPPFIINFISLQETPVLFQLLGGSPVGRESCNHLPDATLSIVCYFHNYHPHPSGYGYYPLISNLRVIGQRRDHFKIAITDLNTVHVNELLIQEGGTIAPYRITDNTPTHLWLQFDKDRIRIVD
jgi:hypothetical protein